jgi:hypothetical protein
MLLRALVLSPFALRCGRRLASATEYASATEALDAVDQLEAEVEARLRALGETVPAARAFVSSALLDHERHRAQRAQLRRRLKLPPARGERPQPSQPRSLAPLRAAQEALVYAHAEGLPALGDSPAVDMMAGHMVDLSRHLTVIDLWIEAEASRG